LAALLHGTVVGYLNKKQIQTDPLNNLQLFTKNMQNTSQKSVHASNNTFGGLKG